MMLAKPVDQEQLPRTARVPLGKRAEAEGS